MAVEQGRALISAIPREGRTGSKYAVA